MSVTAKRRFCNLSPSTSTVIIVPFQWTRKRKKCLCFAVLLFLNHLNAFCSDKKGRGTKRNQSIGLNIFLPSLLLPPSELLQPHEGAKLCWLMLRHSHHYHRHHTISCQLGWVWKSVPAAAVGKEKQKPLYIIIIIDIIIASVAAAVAAQHYHFPICIVLRARRSCGRVWAHANCAATRRIQFVKILTMITYRCSSSFTTIFNINRIELIAFCSSFCCIFLSFDCFFCPSLLFNSSICIDL